MMLQQSINRILILVLLSLATTLLLPSALMAQTSNNNDLCGSVVSGNTELTADLTCEDDGIKAEGNNLIISLNGFTLKGTGAGSNTTGILVDGGSLVRIRGPGTITGFGVGVEYLGASGGAMRDVYLSKNDVGVLLDKSQDTHIKQDYIADNRIGVINRASNNTEVENIQMIRNDKGIHLEKSTSVDLDFNIITDGQVGIYLDSESVRNEVFYNIMFRNNQTDLTFAGAEGNDDTNNNQLGNNQCAKSNPANLC